jgi:hypothetical protein
VFKRLRRNGHQLEKGLQMAQRGPSLRRKEATSVLGPPEEEEGLHAVHKRLLGPPKAAAKNGRSCQ